MGNLKPKEPLLAVMLGVMVTGLGQIYAGEIKRGSIFFTVPIILTIPLMQYILNPYTATNTLLPLLVFLGIGYGIFVIVDAYRCTQAYNVSNNLTRNISAGKKNLLIIGIIFFVFIFNPYAIVSKGISLYIRNNIAQAFKVPSKTMEPTLLPGDMILADKAIYRRQEPKRGDLIIFMDPEAVGKIMVKRLAGLPGETLEIENGSLLVNGASVSEEAFKDRHYYNRGNYAQEGQLVKIPADSYFALGDNSASSKDSRYFGFVPKKYLIGKAYKIYYPFNRSGPIK